MVQTFAAEMTAYLETLTPCQTVVRAFNHKRNDDPTMDIAAFFRTSEKEISIRTATTSANKHGLVIASHYVLTFASVEAMTRGFKKANKAADAKVKLEILIRASRSMWFTNDAF